MRGTGSLGLLSVPRGGGRCRLPVDRAHSAAEHGAAVGAIRQILHRVPQPRRLHRQIAFDKMSPDSVAAEPEVFEAVVRKLRGGHDAAARRAAVRVGTRRRASCVAGGLARRRGRAEPASGPRRAASAEPHRIRERGRRSARRSKVDATALLPKDDESDGFDNVANVLKVSPSFLEQYIAAARVGERRGRRRSRTPKRDSRVYLPRSRGIEPELPRRGHAARHARRHAGRALVSGRRRVRVQHRRARAARATSRASSTAHKLILTIDGVKVFEHEVGGEED